MKNRDYLAAITLALALLACSPPAADSSAASGEPPPEPQLPAGHPPVSASPSDDAIPGPPPGSGTGAAALTWSAPESWQAEPPANAMRRAQYRVPGPAGDGECIVYYFGPGQGGGAEANAQRWADQFAQPDGSDPAEALATEQIAVGGIPVMLVETTGTYSGGMAMMGGPDEQLEDYMLLGAIAEGADANWFFKFTGPRATLEAEREAFLEMVRSLQPGG